MLAFPGIDDTLGGLMADTDYLAQAIGRVFDYRKSLLLEMIDRAGDGVGTDALHKAGRQVLTDAVDSCRQYRFRCNDEKLVTVTGVDFPSAGGV